MFSIAPNKQKYQLVYKSRATPFFPICLMGQSYTLNFKALSGKNLQLREPIFCLIYAETTHWFFPEAFRPLAEKVLQQLLSNDVLFNQARQKAVSLGAQLLEKINLSPQSLIDQKRLNHQGKIFLLDLFNAYLDYAYYVDVPGFLIQVYYLNVIQKKIAKFYPHHSSSQREKIFELIISSPEKTNYENYLSDLYALSLKKQNKGAVRRLAKRYDWLIHDYLGMIIDERYILNQLNEINPSEIKKQLSAARERIERVKLNLKQLPLELRGQAQKIGEFLFRYNEEKKRVINQVNIYLRRLIELVSGRQELAFLHQIYQFSPAEIIDLLMNGFHGREISRRSESWVYKISGGKIETGPTSLLNWLERGKRSRVLKGLPAAPGKLKGKISIVLNVSQISHFRDGAILVAPFTNVNYLPIMQRAKAILTETGGLTSHAAIIARELKKPCIVGINGLLEKLSDGDFIELDAGKGEIKILDDKNNKK